MGRGFPRLEPRAPEGTTEHHVARPGTAPGLRCKRGSEISTAGYDIPDHGDGQRLWNIAPRIPDANRYSRIYRGRPELIDHVFASHTITTLVQDGDIDFHGPRPASITDDPNTEIGRPGSDHRPLLLAIDL